MKYLTVSAICLAGSAVSCYLLSTWCSLKEFGPLLLSLISGAFAILSGCFGFIYLFLSTQPVSHYCSVLGALFHFSREYGLLWYGQRIKNVHLSLCKEPRAAQEQLLKQILKINRDTAYFRDFNLFKVNNLDDLKEKHALTKYDHYKSYIDRIAKGEKDVLLAGLPEKLITTSGSTGKAKLIPCKNVDRFNMIGYALMHATGRESFANWEPMRPKLYLYCSTTVTETDGGIKMAPIANISDSIELMLTCFTTPRVGFNIINPFEAAYIHLLFGIRDKDVGMICSVFTIYVFEALQMLEKEWQRLVEDLSTGSIDPRIELFPEVRSSLTRELGGGSPQRARELKAEFEKGFIGIVKRIWPDVAFISAVDISNLSNYLMETYCKGVSIFSDGFGGSEGWYGSNFSPLSPSAEYVALIQCCVFEFIPEKDIEKSDPKTFFIDEILVGKNYELVITQDSGLYRYRMGDVVHVTGFYQKCPKLKFLHRTGSLLNMFGEKVSSDIVNCAVRDALSKTYPDFKLLFHTVSESILIIGTKIELVHDLRRAHYIFFLEVEGTVQEVTDIDTGFIGKHIDINLGKQHLYLRSLQTEKKIASSIVYLVHPGSFLKLKDDLIANTSATSNQFKFPEKLRNPEMFAILFKCRIK